MSSLSRTLIRNTVSGAAAYLVGLGVSLLLTPYILSRLGVEQYGIWVILSATITYFGLLDLGVGSAFIKHLTEAQTLGNSRRRNDIIATGWLFYALFSAAVLVVGWLVQPPLFRFLKLGENVAPVYWVVLAVFVVRTLCMVYRSLLFSLHQLELLNGIAVVAGLLNATATVALLAAGYGLTGLAAAGLATALFHVTAEVVMAYRRCPGLQLSLSRATRETFRQLFRYGVQVQASKGAELVHMNADKLLLGHFVGLGQVTFYELGSKVAGLTRSLPTVLLPAILPAAAELHAQRNPQLLRELYERGSKYLVVIAFPLAGFTVVSAQPMMTAWLGARQLTDAVLALQVLTVAYLFYLLTGMGMAVARGIGVVQYEMKALITAAVLNVCLSTVLAMTIGLRGVLCATAFSMIVGYSYFLTAFHRYMKISWPLFFRHVYAVPLAGIVAAAAAVLTLGYPLGLLQAQAEQGRLASFLVLAVNGVVFSVVYGSIVIRYRYIALGDWHVVRRAFAAPS